MITTIKTNSREEWLDLRHKYIGGSDASAVIGLNPYRSAYSLWAEKTGKIPGFEGNLTTTVGAYLEDLVAHLFEEETGKKVQRKNATYINDEYPFACANIDRAVVGEDAFLEIKTTTSVPLIKKLRKGEGFPEAYYCQCVHYMAVTGKKKAYLAVLINCRELKVYELERDEAEIEALMNAEKDFWELVKKDEAPAPDGTDSTSETISALYPNDNGETVDLTKLDDILNEYVVLSLQEKSIKAMKDDAANRIKDYMKDAAKGEGNRYNVTYTTASRKTFDTKSFANDYRAIDLDKYYKTSSYRTFKVTERK